MPPHKAMHQCVPAAVRAVDALQAAVADGQLDRGAAIHALQRVLALRGQRG